MEAPKLDGFDHFAPDLVRDWRETFEQIRTRCPVARVDAHGGYVLVATRDEVVSVLRNPEVFSSDRPGGSAIPPLPFRNGFLEMDAPDHTRYRRMVAPLFSAAVVEQRREEIGQLVDACIDEFVEAGACDVVAELAGVVPLIVALTIVGLPRDRHVQYGRVFHALAHGAPTAPGALDDIAADIADLVAKRGSPPGTAAHVFEHALVDGEPMSDELITEFLFTLLTGGTDTTSSLAGHAMMHFATHQDDRERVAADPAVLPRMVEELIRIYPPVMNVVRHVTRPTVLRGVQLAPGDRVMLSLASANFDGSYIDDPASVRMDRGATSNMTFGFGHHRCIAARLAAVQVEIVLERVFRRIPDFVVDLEHAVPYPSAPIANGYVSIPIRFTPGTRVATATLAELTASTAS